MELSHTAIFTFLLTSKVEMNVLPFQSIEYLPDDKEIKQQIKLFSPN